MIIAAVLTGLLLPTVSVMAWRCWNLPPVPVIRIWSLSFAAMSAAMLGQLWMCQYWRAKFVECQELRLQLPPESPQQQQPLSSTAFRCQYRAFARVAWLASRPGLLRGAATTFREHPGRSFSSFEHECSEAYNTVATRMEGGHLSSPALWPSILGDIPRTDRAAFVSDSGAGSIPAIFSDSPPYNLHTEAGPTPSDFI